MSAAEIIEQIKALPAEERRRVIAFARTAGELDASENSAGVRYADNATFAAAADRVFEKHAELFKKLAE